MIYRDRGGIVQTARRVAAGELAADKLPKSTARKVDAIRAALGDTLSAPPTKRRVGGQYEKVRRARTA